MNKKFLNWSIIITLLIAYVVPGRTTDGVSFDFGYPIAFFTMYNKELTPGDSILNSTLFNIGGLVFNIVIMYLIISFANKLITKNSEKNTFNEDVG